MGGIASSAFIKLCHTPYSKSVEPSILAKWTIKIADSVAIRASFAVSVTISEILVAIEGRTNNVVILVA